MKTYEELLAKYGKEIEECARMIGVTSKYKNQGNVNMNLSKELVEKYGEEFQLDKCIEECAELIDAISKYKQGRLSEDEVLNEIADVQMCIPSAVYVLNENGNYSRILNGKEAKIREIVTVNLI